MCFSATASFTGAAVITVAGVGSLALVRKPREVLFAALPLGFAIHQALEGVTWLELDGTTNKVLEGWGVHLWVLYAWALLPIWLALGVWLLEPDERRRRLMLPLVVIGGLLSLFMLTQAFAPGIHVVVVGPNLDYQLPFAAPAWILGAPYVLATCLTPTMCTKPFVRIFGIANFGAVIIAAIWKAKDFSSIWCTLAAGLSFIIFVHYLDEWRLRRHATPVPAPAI